jgi:hypothetical protein
MDGEKEEGSPVVDGSNKSIGWMVLGLGLGFGRERQRLQAATHDGSAACPLLELQ